MLLSTHVTSVLFLVRFNNFALTTYGLLLELHALTQGTHFYVLLAGVILKLTLDSVCDIAPLILLCSADN